MEKVHEGSQVRVENQQYVNARLSFIRSSMLMHISDESASKKDVTKILKTIGVEEANLWYVRLET